MLAKLKGKISEKGFNQKTMSEAIGMTEQTFSRKITGKTEFTWGEIQRIAMALEIYDEPEEMKRIFFT